MNEVAQCDDHGEYVFQCHTNRLWPHRLLIVDDFRVENNKGRITILKKVYLTKKYIIE